MTSSLTSEQRQERGVQVLANLVNYWFARSGFSHHQLAAILDWAWGEHNPNQSSVLSRIRNGYQKRGAGLQHLDAIAQGNRAIWLWQSQGEAAAVEQFGPYQGWSIQPEWVDGAIWLPSASDSGLPLDLGELALLLAGRLELPYLSDAVVSPGDAKRLNDGLLALLDRITRERSWSAREAVAQFIAAYPATDRARQQRLKAVVLGDETLNPDQLEGELAALAEMLRVVRGLAMYTPGDLRAELLSERP